MKNQLTILLLLLIAVLAIIVALGFIPPVERATGILHPEYKTMLKSGNSVVQSTTVKWMAYLFGLAIFGIFALCALIGAHKKEAAKRKKINRILILGFTLCTIIFSLMVFSYWNYDPSANARYFWGVPVPTAWMLYPLWFSPVIITLIFILRFDDFVINDEELVEFNRIVRARREREK